MERPAHRVASVMSGRPARRRAPIARLRRAAMILGPFRVLTWDLSSCHRVSRIFSRGGARPAELDLRVSAGQRLVVMKLPDETGVVQLPRGVSCQRGVADWLSRVISSRLAARAAESSSSRSSSCRRRSAACCSRWVIFWLSASMSAGAPSPDSRQACWPSASDSRCSSWRTRVLSRMARSWAASRSACRDARVTAGSCGVAGGGRCGFGRVDFLQQVAVPVEEGAVDAGGAGDA